MNDITALLYGSNDERNWSLVARIRQREDIKLPPPSEFKSAFRFHRYDIQEYDPPLPNGLPPKRTLDGTWGWR